MNHNGDTNKMVSDTPMTDAECGDYDRSGCWKSYINGECVQSDFARQLERELNAANSRIELLMSANADVARIAGERDAAEKRVKRLEAVVNDPHALWTNWLRGDVKLPAGIGDVRQYQDRMKRLEEALEGTVKWIIHLADSGDAGFWHVDDQPEIIAARAALKKEDK